MFTASDSERGVFKLSIFMVLLSQKHILPPTALSGELGIGTIVGSVVINVFVGVGYAAFKVNDTKPFNWRYPVRHAVWYIGVSLDGIAGRN